MNLTLHHHVWKDNRSDAELSNIVQALNDHKSSVQEYLDQALEANKFDMGSTINQHFDKVGLGHNITITLHK